MWVINATLLLAAVLAVFALSRRRQKQGGSRSPAPAHTHQGATTIFGPQRTSSSLSKLEDPKAIATTLMVAVAKAGDGIHPHARRAIEAQLETRFRVPEAQIPKIIAQVERALPRNVGLEQIFDEATAILRRHCTREQREDILKMLREVAGAFLDKQSRERGDLIARLRNRIS